jgi:ribosomal protein L6P/L9E
MTFYFFLVKNSLVNIQSDKNMRYIVLSNNNKKITNIPIHLDLMLLYKMYSLSLFKLKRCIVRMLLGIIRGYCIILDIIGLGFSVTMSGQLLRMNIGYNHSIFYIVSDLVLIRAKRKILYCFSYSLFDLKKIIVDITNFRKLNPYKLKGIKEKNELYIKKN